MGQRSASGREGTERLPGRAALKLRKGGSMTTNLNEVAAPSQLGHFIGGKLLAGSGERWGDVFNPATGEVAARVPMGAGGVVEAAVKAASGALPRWADTPPLHRARVMFKFKELLERNAGEL